MRPIRSAFTLLELLVVPVRLVERRVGQAALRHLGQVGARGPEVLGEGPGQVVVAVDQSLVVAAGVGGAEWGTVFNGRPPGVLHSYSGPPDYADRAVGGTAWDSYSWHTDLPPGHPMVHGDQTSDFELFDVENASLVVVWGMNWITTKMPDSHWLTEARLKGTRIVVIACEYSATSTKADEAIVVRPGTTPALALGLSHVILRDRLYDGLVDAIARIDPPLVERTIRRGHDALVRAGIATLIVAGLAVAAAAGLLPWTTLMAVSPGVVVALALALRPPAASRLRTVGWTLVSASAATAIMLIVGLTGAQ